MVMVISGLLLIFFLFIEIFALAVLHCREKKKEKKKTGLHNCVSASYLIPMLKLSVGLLLCECVVCSDCSD